jgi:benzaldehyde dehydrogenase (NAD)
MSTVERCNALHGRCAGQGREAGVRRQGQNTLMPATVLDHVTPAMQIYHEEASARSRQSCACDGVEEAVACANDNEYGLSSAVFGRDVGARMERGARSTRASAT